MSQPLQATWIAFLICLSVLLPAGAAERIVFASGDFTLVGELQIP
jgi:hypothetical protein